MEKIEQRHRDAAADALLAGKYGQHEKAKLVAQLMREGKADDHPSVQARAFYEANPQ